MIFTSFFISSVTQLKRIFSEKCREVLRKESKLYLFIRSIRKFFYRRIEGWNKIFEKF